MIKIQYSNKKVCYIEALSRIFPYNVHDTQYSLTLQAIETLNEQIHRLNIRPFQSKGALYMD